MEQTTQTAPGPRSSTSGKKPLKSKPTKRRAKQLDLFDEATQSMPGECPAVPAKKHPVEFTAGKVYVLAEFAEHGGVWFCRWLVQVPGTGRGVPFNHRPAFAQPRQAFEQALDEIIEYVESTGGAIHGLLGWNPPMPV